MYIAGIDIGGTAVKMGVMDGETQALVRTMRRETGRLSPEEMARAIGEMFREMNAAILNEKGEAICSAGVVCAGRVYPDEGLVTAGNLGWMKEPLGKFLRAELGIPVVMDNDVQGALYGEWKCGICKGLDSAVYVTLGTGIGGAFLFGGKMFRGVDHEGGEIGHMITHSDGEDCACGGRGCWEVYASATALSRYAGGAEARDVFALAQNGDEKMRAALELYVHELCIGLASLNSMFRPDMIVIGGGLSGAGSALLDPIIKELSENSPSIPHGVVPCIKLASLGNSAGMLGAALIAQDNIPCT